MTVGQLAAWLATNSRAAASSSFGQSTPTMANPSAPYFSSASTNSGNSARQGTHHEAQKLTMTGRPRSEARSNAAPSRVVPVNLGAARPAPAPAGSGVPQGRAALSWAQPATTTIRRVSRSTAERRGPRTGRWNVSDDPYLTVSSPTMVGCHLHWNL